jgi:O-antigen/teichoic acid export membrane protein
MYVTFTLMLGMAAFSESMIVTLIGKKWLPAVQFLQLLCLAAMLYPLQALNLNIFNIKGRTDIMLRLEIVKKLLAVPVIIAGIYAGIMWLLAGMVLHSLLCYFINAYYSGRLIGYSVREQLADIFPSFLVALLVAIPVYALRFVPGLPQPVILVLQASLLLVMTVLLAKRLRLQGYIEIRSIVLGKLPSLKRWL